jgi:excisionase family DNA binding protein
MKGHEGALIRIAEHRAAPVSTLAECDRRSLAFVSAAEAAAIMRTDPRTVRRAVAVGSIPATRVGAVLRVPVAWLREQAREKGAA